MKVIKKPEQWKPRQVQCASATPDRACGALLEIEFSDLRRIYHEADAGDQREQAWDEIFVSCPECENRIRVRDVPPYQAARIPHA